MQSGFTLIELILVVTIAAVIGFLSVPFYSRFFNQNAVANTEDQFAGELRKAGLYSMAGRQGGQWGVAYNNNTITLFQGNSYAARNTAFDEKFSVSSNVSVSGFSEVEFYRMTGTASASQSITISGGGNSRIVTLNAQGGVSK